MCARGFGSLLTPVGRPVPWPSITARKVHLSPSPTRDRGSPGVPIITKPWLCALNVSKSQWPSSDFSGKVKVHNGNPKRRERRGIQKMVSKEQISVMVGRVRGKTTYGEGVGTYAAREKWYFLALLLLSLLLCPSTC